MILAATILIVAAIGILYVKGFFLPAWVTIKETEVDTSFLKKGVKVQDTLFGDIDFDGEDELLILCWRIGRYGKRRPFWVKHDELTWSQHIYIYENDKDNPDNPYKEKWLASDIRTLVKDWEMIDNHLLRTYTPNGESNIFIWNSWGLERVSEELADKYIEKLRESKDTVGPDNVQNSDRDSEAISEANDSEENSESSDETDDNISILMVGDVLLHDGVVASCKKDDGTYDFAPLFINTADTIRKADIAIVNQEVILGGEELRISGYPAFNAPYEVGDALYDAGFDVVCHATNHALDRNKKGIENCLNYWRGAHPDMTILGIHDEQSSLDDICIKEAAGLKIAILNYTYGTNGIPLPKDMPYAVDLLNREIVARDLAYAEENADFTIVCPHWGIEYQLDYSKDQKSWAQFMTENGADLIIATHPHVIEPIEWVESENGNKALCYYSLGNFINWTSGRGKNVANRMVGGMAYVELTPKAGDFSMDSDRIAAYTAYPLVSHVCREKGKVSTYFLEDYTEELAENNVIKEQDSAFSIEYCRGIIDRVWGF